MKSQYPFCVATLIVFVCALIGCSSEKENGQSNDASNGDTNEVAKSDSPNSLIPSAKWSDWDNDLNEMVTTLGLDDDEKQKLADTFQQQQDVIEKWMAEGGDKLKEFDDRLLKAWKEKDLSGLRQLNEEAAPLKQWLTNLIKDRERAILDALSPEKRDQWQGHQLVERFRDMAESIEISPEQMDKIKELAVSAAQKVRDEPNPKAAGFLQLEKSVEQQVFDELQKKAYEKVKDKNPLRSLKDTLFGG